MTLPDKKQEREKIDPLRARVFLAGTPKVGKSTLAAGWMPDTTLIVDTHNGTHMLDGEHYIAHVKTWAEFQTLVAEIQQADRFRTIVLDLIDDLWVFCDIAHAGKGKVSASSTDDYGRSGKAAETDFRSEVGKLLALPVGVWFLTHTKSVEDGGTTRYVPKLDAKVSTFVSGASDFVLLAEAFGPKRTLHTAPSAKFEAGSRRPLPPKMDLDARQLYAAMDRAFNGQAEAEPAEAPEPEAVPA